MKTDMEDKSQESVFSNSISWGNVLRSKDIFHRFFENRRIWKTQAWLGIPVYKLPFDTWIMQEIIYETRPDLIIETGTAKGGGALFFSSICELIGHGEVITVDINPMFSEEVSKIRAYPFSKRMEFIHGSSINSSIEAEVARKAEGKECMVVLDSWHTKQHVLREIEIYHRFVGIGKYMIVEDTHVNGHPVEWIWGEGPMEAIEEWMRTQNEGKFETDYDREKFLMTYNPSGYLRRIR